MLDLNLIEENEVESAIQQIMENECQAIAVATTFEQANAIVEQIKRLQERKEFLAEQTKEAIAKYKIKAEEFLNKETNTIDGQIERYKEIIAPFVMSNIEGTGKKSINFISGTAGFRKQKPLVSVDPEEIESLAADDDRYYKITRKFSASTFLKDVEVKNGKAFFKDKPILSYSTEEQEDSFYIK